jgi:hypothetical protein
MFLIFLLLLWESNSHMQILWHKLQNTQVHKQETLVTIFQKCIHVAVENIMLVWHTCKQKFYILSFTHTHTQIYIYIKEIRRSYKDLNKANISNMLSSKKLHHTWFSKAENLWCDSRNLEEDELDMWKLPQNLQLSQHCSYCHNVDVIFVLFFLTSFFFSSSSIRLKTRFMGWLLLFSQFLPWQDPRKGWTGNLDFNVIMPII